MFLFLVRICSLFMYLFLYVLREWGEGKMGEKGGGGEKGEEGWEEGLPVKLIKTETVVITFMFFI